MAFHNTETVWGLPARLIHWIMAVMIFMMLIFGTIMAGTNDLIAKFQMVQTHKSMGFTVFVLAVVRVLWRWRSPTTPALPQDMPRWQVAASHASHHLLYLLILAIPLSGWLMVTSSPLNDADAYPMQVRNMVWGLFEMPDLFATGSEHLSQIFASVHWVLTKVLMAILALHVLAALKHQFIDRDGLLMRMIRG